MRLAPVAIRFLRDRDAALSVAEAQTRTTHGSPATIAASRAIAELLVEAIAGTPFPELLSSRAAAVEGSWRGVHRDAIQGSHGRPPLRGRQRRIVAGRCCPPWRCPLEELRPEPYSPGIPREAQS